MRFRFCGDGDCPDWVLAEINTLSRLSSIKLKMLTQIVFEGLLNPPLNITKLEKLFIESKLDPDRDLKACVACLRFIITSGARFNCEHVALCSELQQLGLPREHSIAIKRVVDEHGDTLKSKLAAKTLRLNRIANESSVVNRETKLCELKIEIEGNIEHRIQLTPQTIKVLLENLKEARTIMAEFINNSYNYV